MNSLRRKLNKFYSFASRIYYRYFRSELCVRLCMWMYAIYIQCITGAQNFVGNSE